MFSCSLSRHHVCFIHFPIYGKSFSYVFVSVGVFVRVCCFLFACIFTNFRSLFFPQCVCLKIIFGRVFFYYWFIAINKWLRLLLHACNPQLYHLQYTHTPIKFYVYCDSWIFQVDIKPANCRKLPVQIAFQVYHFGLFKRNEWTEQKR